MSSLLSAKDIELHYNSKHLLDKISFVLNSRDIIGLVGKNGCGKSSLLKILATRNDFDGGKIEFKNNCRIGYLSQDFEFEDGITVGEEIEKATTWIKDLITKYETQKLGPTEKHELFELITRYHGWDLVNHVEVLCNNFGVPPLTKKIHECSGGQQRRLALVSALVGFPDILLLDEPTNHLDLGTIDKLEKLLKNYEGAVLLISHDRYFLDNVATRIWELWQSTLFTHQGGYTKYLQNKAIRLEIEKSRDWKNQQFLTRELSWVNAGVKARATKDKGRLKRFYELKDKTGLEEDNQVEMILPEPTSQGSRVLELEKVYYEHIENGTKSNIIHDFSFSFQPGHKIGIVGNNGVGKTTFLKILMSQLESTKGTIKTGVNTEFLYFDQKKVNLNTSKTPFEELADGAEKMDFGNIQISSRKYLEAWLFSRQKYNSTIKHLSGGEKSRLILAKILATGGNFLILDEPTNDLDLDTLRVLEESLIEFEGTLVVVSHDRYFLNRVCNYVFGFEGNGAITISTGNFDDYLGKKIDPMLIRSYREALKAKEKQLKQDKTEKINKLSRIEKEIELVEASITKAQAPFEDPEFYLRNPERAKKLHQEITTLERQQEYLMTKWESLGTGEVVIQEVTNSTVDESDIIIKAKPTLK
jgi:ABC transport system ATP-binding/permease protein